MCQGQENPAVEISECYYNALRLLFLVYSQYQGSNCLDLGQLASYPEVLQARNDCVIQDLNQIVSAHENALSASGNSASIDLLYNTALVYTEIIENLENENEIVEAVHRSKNLFEQVFRRNFEEFQKSNSDLGNQKQPNTSVSNAVSPEVDETDNSKSREILDTAISIFNLFRTYIDCTSIVLNQLIVSELQSTLSEVDVIISELLNQYSQGALGSIIFLQDQKNEYAIVREYAKNTLLNLDSACLNWDNEALPETAERFMLAADSIQTILDRNGLSAGLGIQSEDVEVYWAALSKMNTYLKKAQEILMNRNTELKKTSGTEQKGLGALILQICTVYIARADIDQQRSQLQHPEGKAHLEILARNVVAFLKNAVALSKQSGGIREIAVEKLQREKCRIDAQVRLYVLEGMSLEEISSQFKSNLWQEEYDFCVSTWFYKQ